VASGPDGGNRRRSLGPFFVVGVLSLAHGLYHGRMRWVGLGAAAIWADLEMPLAQRLKRFFELVH